jgi:hypothetical protein
MLNTPERLEALKKIYESYHGAIHPALFNFSPELQIVMLELALNGELDIRATKVEKSPTASDDILDQIRRFVVPN